MSEHNQLLQHLGDVLLRMRTTLKEISEAEYAGGITELKDAQERVAALIRQIEAQQIPEAGEVDAVLEMLSRIMTGLDAVRSMAFEEATQATTTHTAISSYLRYGDTEK